MTEANMMMPDARVTWGGRCSVGWLTPPLSPVAPNRGRISLRAPRAGVFSGSFSGADWALSPMRAGARPREG